MTDDMQPWPTLTDFLDAGGDPSLGWHDWESLVDFLVTELGLFTPAARARHADLYDEWSRQPLEHVNRICTPGREVTPERHADTCRMMARESELCTDPALEARVLALIPPEWRAYEHKQRDLYRRPHPLSVNTTEALYFWNYHNCGTAFDADEGAIIVGGAPKAHLDHDENVVLGGCFG